MNFKNAYIFAFTKPFTTTTDLQLLAAMHDDRFTPCASTELSHYGWTNALGESLTHESDGNILICARKEEKILPAPVVKEMVNDAIETLNVEYNRTVTKKEREQIKEDVIFELLPRAFSRITDTHAYINAKENIIVINSTSRGKAEDLLALLRKSLGTLPVTSVSTEVDPCEIMTDWIRAQRTQTNEISNCLYVGHDAELKDFAESAPIVKFKNMDLYSSEVLTCVNLDMKVVNIELNYDDSITFMLHDDLSIKRIKFSDVITEQNDDIDSDKLARLNADFTLMAGELNRMINALHAEFSVKATDYLKG